MDSIPLYSLRATEVFRELETSAAGLSSGEADARRDLYGDNILSEPPTESRWRSLIGYLAHPMALILWGAGVLAFVARQPALGVVIWVIVLLNAALTFWQEYRAAQAVRALRELLPAYARLVRSGGEAMVPTDEIVPGDILVLAEGDNIPADARVIEEYGLRTNNANLTGEAIPARKTADASLREGISEIERPNLVFAGSSVYSGTGRAVVYATGMLTQFGRIAHLTQAVPQIPSRLQRELSRTSHVISLLALGVAAIVFVVGVFDVGLKGFEAFLLALGILVAAVPEG
ncbi:MAG TPA: HAD-IC family P-type ATPase, partial [Anaerolineales bacterium]|nr:HAD-IC family P-type ATPase [Anaerolineales bacterium]